MALPDILPIADFFGLLPLIEFRPMLMVSNQISGRTQGGAVLTAGLGADYWAGTATLRPVRRSIADEILARIAYLEGPGRFFLAHAFPRFGPRNDPTGALLGAALPKIHSLASNNREARIRDLPVGYSMGPGDFLAHQYAGNPVRYAYHRVVGPRVQAAATGITPMIEVEPPIRPGALVGAAVTLFKPAFKAMIDPGSVNQGSGSGPWVSGISFGILQVIGR